MSQSANPAPYWDFEKLFQLFKYLIYAAILGDVIYFIMEDISATAFTYKNGVGLSEIGNAFAASVS